MRVSTNLVLVLGLLYLDKSGVQAAKYDFGLIENEPLLRELCKEDRTVHQELVSLNSVYESVQLDYYLKNVYGNLSEISVNEYVKHPINSYNLIRRASIHMKELVLNLKKEDTKDSSAIKGTLKVLLDESKILNTVTNKDLYGALKGILIISHTYDTDIEKFRKGEFAVKQGNNVTVFKTDSKLKMDDLHVLAEAAVEMGFINTAVKYVGSAVNAATEEKADKANRKKILALRKKILNMHNGLLSKRKTYLTDEQITNPYFLDEQLKKRGKQPKFVKDLRHQDYDMSLIIKYGGDFFDMQKMMDGCRGFNSLRSAPKSEVKTDIKCNFVHHSDPYVKLGPFKMEFASRSPHIVVFHEIMTEEDINHFVEFATPRLSRSRENLPDASYSKKDRAEGKVKVIYKSVQAWMKTIEFAGMEAEEYTPNNFTILDRRAEKLSSRLEKALDLNVTNQWSSHQYQVTNYGLAGLCEAHVDPHGYLEGADVTGKEHLTNSGDYIGTVMGYLEDTPAGGSTTFFKFDTEVTIWPTRGSAAFWFSLYTDGVRDPASSHGGCPVAVGSKWILNKWIYSFNNWDKQPCLPRDSQHYSQYEYDQKEMWTNQKDRMSWPDSSYY